MRLLACFAALLCSCSPHDDKPPPRPEPVRVAETPAPTPTPAKPSPGVSQRLFAKDVPGGTLPLSLAIETIGGVSTILIPRGTKLPISHSEVFSTALDNQASVEVHVLQGERPLAADNRSLGKFQLRGIPPAPRGVPQVEVTFTVDDEGQLEVTARDKATNEMKEIVIYGAIAALDKATLDKILADTAAAQGDDDRRRVWSETRIKLETMIYEGKRSLGSLGDKLSPTMRKRWQDELSRAEALLATSTTPGDPKLLLVATESLQKTLHAGSEELYKNAN